MCTRFPQQTLEVDAIVLLLWQVRKQESSESPGTWWGINRPWQQALTPPSLPSDFHTGLPSKVFWADWSAIMVQPRAVTKLGKWIQLKKKTHLKKKICSPKKTTNSIPKPNEHNTGIVHSGIRSMPLALIVWITKRTKENFFSPRLACENHKHFNMLL